MKMKYAPSRGKAHGLWFSWHCPDCDERLLEPDFPRIMLSIETHKATHSDNVPRETVQIPESRENSIL